MRRPPPSLLVSVVVALLAGCGGEDERAPATERTGAAEKAPTEERSNGDLGRDGDGEGNGMNAAAGSAVEEVIAIVLTDAGSPEDACGTYVTERFVARSYGGRQNCLASRQPEALASDVEVEVTREDDASAEAVAVPEGGVYDGIEVEVGLVRANGSWAVDSLEADVPPGP